MNFKILESSVIPYMVKTAIYGVEIPQDTREKAGRGLSTSWLLLITVLTTLSSAGNEDAVIVTWLALVVCQRVSCPSTIKIDALASMKLLTMFIA